MIQIICQSVFVLGKNDCFSAWNSHKSPWKPFSWFYGTSSRKKSKSFYKVTYFSKYYQVAKNYSKLKFWSFHHSIDEAQWFVASSLKYLSPDIKIVMLLCKIDFSTFEPRREKTCLWGFRHCPTQSRLYSHRRWLGY